MGPMNSVEELVIVLAIIGAVIWFTRRRRHA